MSKSLRKIADDLGTNLIAGGGSYSAPYARIMLKDGGVITVNAHAIIITIADIFRNVLEEKPLPLPPADDGAEVRG